MNRPFETSRYFDYECSDLPRGVRLHIISQNTEPSPLLYVSVATGFGSTHLSCLDESGGVKHFPVGMAHFMEHLLFWLHFDDVLIPMSYKYLRDPNAVVTYDRSVWGISGAGMLEGKTYSPVKDQRRLAGAAGDIVRSFLSILRTGRPRSEINSLIAKTVNDVGLEIGHRHDNSDYVLKLELLSSLYREDPIRFDILGTRESLREITGEHINLALKVIRTNIRSVTVMGHGLSDGFVSEVRQLVSQAVSEQPAEKAVRPIPPPVESSEVNRLSAGVRCGWDYDWALGVLGVKLPPPQRAAASAEEAGRSVLINYLAMNHLSLGAGGILSPRARAYFVSGVIEDRWFYWEQFTLRQVMDGFRRELVGRLNTYRESFEPYLAGTLKGLMREPRNLMRLCNTADLFGFKLNELTGASGSVSEADLDKLIAELRDAEGNVSLAYTEA
ncbi:MAG: hypothetical protein M3416_10380 [Acidobacteriota bacterium]|nr:hypothetical protein [Acidobacteriota bacterium]